MKDISIEYMSIKDLKPYKKNPRKNDGAVDAVAESIKNFGFKNPIVIDGKGEIINGHTRLKAAKKLHLETVPVIRADDLTPEQVKAFRIADNATGEIAEWDFDLLSAELGEIADIDMGGFGILTDESGDLLLNVDGQDISYSDYKTQEISADAPGMEADEEGGLIVKNPLDNIELRLFEGVGEYNIPRLEPVKEYDGTPFVSWGEFHNKEIKENRGGGAWRAFLCT